MTSAQVPAVVAQTRLPLAHGGEVGIQKAVGRCVHDARATATAGASEGLGQGSEASRRRVLTIQAGLGSRQEAPSGGQLGFSRSQCHQPRGSWSTGSSKVFCVLSVLGPGVSGSCETLRSWGPACRIPPTGDTSRFSSSDAGTRGTYAPEKACHIPPGCRKPRPAL